LTKVSNNIQLNHTYFLGGNKMKKIKKVLVGFVTLLIMLSVTPISAHAEWRQGNSGWWYSQGNSYTIGWTKIDGQWYYFDSKGYMKTGWIYDSGNWYYLYGEGIMAHDTTIDGCYLNSNGAWTTNIPTSSSSGGNSYSSGSTNNQSQTVYVSNNGIYHSSPNAHGMKHYTTMSRAEAEKAGYRACEKCY
jgi:hypothetical protein